MAKTVTIPAGDNPFVCKINDVYYSYPAGTTVEVPDAVAALIQANAGNREKSNGLSDIAIPRDGEVNDVLTRTADGAEWATPAAPEPELPSVSGSDNGKVLKVVEGAWAAASGGGGSDSSVLVVHEVDSVLDKTWQEIHDAMVAGKSVVRPIDTGDLLQLGYVLGALSNDWSVHIVDCEPRGGEPIFLTSYFADSASGYPIVD